jgi:H/ACA ribonucleoprotein complex subunit 2
MAKDKSEKKDKKEKKEKRAEVDGVKKVKKDKKDKKTKDKSPKAVDAILNEVETKAPTANGAKDDVDMDGEEVTLRTIPKEALVPFANPLADEKQTKKVLKSVKRG